MENKKIYLISDASKKVKVESHVLRYWEDELKLPVKRNELGHRYYTEEDIMEFQEIKKLKEQGLQLKAIRMILKNGKLTRLPDVGGLSAEDLQRMEQGTFCEQQREGGISAPSETAERTAAAAQENFSSGRGEKLAPAMRRENLPEREAEAKMKRLEYLMKKLIAEAVEESNEKFYEELSETLTKELDYQFRMQEEREEQRENRKLQLEEEHYKQLDALLRGKSGRKKRESRKQEGTGKRKLFGKPKKA